MTGKPAASMPPPLPPKGKTGAFPSAPAAHQPIHQRTAVVPPNASPSIGALQGLQAAPAFAIPNIPTSFQRPPPGDPFQEPAEPRIPVGVDSEEKLKVFRGIMKGKDEALGRGRALYQAVDLEAQQLRAITTQMKGQLELAMVEVQRAADYPQQLQLLKDMLEKDTS